MKYCDACQVPSECTHKRKCIKGLLVKKKANRPSGETACSASDTIALVRRYNRWRRGNESLEMERPKVIGEALDSICDIAERLDCERDSMKEIISSMQNEILTLREASISYPSLDSQNVNMLPLAAQPEQTGDNKK